MVLVWNRHKPVVELNWLMGSQPFPLDNWIFNGNTVCFELFFIIEAHVPDQESGVYMCGKYICFYDFSIRISFKFSDKVVWCFIVLFMTSINAS